MATGRGRVDTGWVRCGPSALPTRQLGGRRRVTRRSSTSVGRFDGGRRVHGDQRLAHRTRPDHHERTVSLRMERQSRLFDDTEPLNLTVLIEESVLDRPIGSTATMRAQLEHLITMSEQDNVEVLVLPTALGAHDRLVGPFALLDFAAAQSIVYVEIVDGAVYVQGRLQVTGYARIVNRLRAVALSPARTAEAIRSRLSAMS
ncbi:MAG TPA: DUF5753 domain-containing protein [Pseudonocardiaceae bacterium]